MRLIILTCLLSITSTVGHAETSQNLNTKPQLAQDHRGTKKQPLVIEGIPRGRTEAEAREEREHREKQALVGSSVSDSLKVLKRESEITTIFTGLLFLIALVQAGFFLWQLRILQASIKDARIAALASRQSAKSTKATVRVMEDTAERQLRAYVMANSVVVSPLDGRGDVAVRLVVKNYGATPAYRFSWIHLLQVVDWPLLVVPEPSPEEIALMSLFGDIPPGALINTAITHRAITAEERGAMMHGIKALVLSTHMSYTDAFDKIRETKICYLVGGPHGIDHGEMSAHDRGNEST